MLRYSSSSVPFMAIRSSLRSRGRSYAVVNAIERCGKPDMVFHAVLRYPSVRNRILDRNLPVRKLSIGFAVVRLVLGKLLRKRRKKSDTTFFKMEPDWCEGMSLLVNLMTLRKGGRFLFWARPLKTGGKQGRMC